MEDNQVKQYSGNNSPAKSIIPRIDFNKLPSSPQKLLILRRNLMQSSEHQYQSRTPDNRFHHRIKEEIQGKLQRSQSNDIISQSDYFSESLGNNDSRYSSTQYKKIGNTFLNDQLEEQKQHKIKEELQKQIALQQKKIKQLESKSKYNSDSEHLLNENAQKGLNLNKFLEKKDAQIESKRNFIKQKLAEINFENVKMLSQQKIFNKKKSNEKPSILISTKINNKIIPKMPNISQRSSILVNGQPIQDISDIASKNLSIAGNLDAQFEQEKQKLLSINQKDIYFSSVMEAPIPDSYQSVTNANQAVIPIRKRIPQISTDHQMNQALAVLINKTKEQRNHEDIAILMKATKQIPFFNKIESKVLLFQSLCKSMQYQYIPKGGIVFYQGDFPDRFYITLKGKVSILIPKKPEDINKEDNFQKEKQPKFTIHKRFLYRSLHRAYKRLCNILYFILIVRVKANILQQLPENLVSKSKQECTLNSLAEGDIEDSDESSINHPRNHSIVIAQESINEIKKSQKSKAELEEINEFVDDQIEKAMKGIKQLNTEKKLLFKQQISSNTNLKLDSSRLRPSINLLEQSTLTHQQSTKTPIQPLTLDFGKVSNINKPTINKDFLYDERKSSQFDLLDIKNDLKNVGLNKITSNISNISSVQPQLNHLIPLSLRIDSYLKTSIGEKQKDKSYQPIQPPQSYLEIVSHFKNISQPSQILVTKESNQNQDSMNGIPSTVLQDYVLKQNDDTNTNTSQKEFRQPVDKYKDMILQKMLNDETSDPSYNSNQLYFQKLDQDMKDMKERSPSFLHIGQVENFQLAQKLQNASQAALKKRSFLKIAIDCFVNTNNQNTFKLYSEKKKIIETQIKGLDLESLENGAHFFKNNTFKYNHAFSSGDGLVFGELGILNKKPRAATIICLEDSYFGYLSAQNYQQILMKKEKNSLVKKREFIEQTLLSEQISVEKMSKISYYFHKRKCQSGEVVFKEGDLSTHVYLIKKGEVELQKEEEVITNESELSKVTIRVAKLSTREYFGDCDIFYNRNRKYTAIVTMQSTIYFCEKAQFMKQLEEIKDFWEKYGEKIKKKEIYRNQLIEDSKRTRNFEKNLRKFSPQKKRKLQQQQAVSQQQQMDSIICGVNIPQINLQQGQIRQGQHQNITLQENIGQSFQFSSRQDLENDATIEKPLMTKSAYHTPRKRNNNQNSTQSFENMFQSMNNNNNQTKNSYQNYNQERTHNASQDNQTFYSPDKVQHMHNKSLFENKGYLSDRIFNESPIKQVSSGIILSSRDLHESKTEGINQSQRMNQVQKIQQRLYTPLTKKDVKNVYVPIKSAKDLALDDEDTQVTNQVNKYQHNKQLILKKNQNNDQITTTKTNLTNDNMVTNKQNVQHNQHNMSQNISQKQDRKAGLIFGNTQQQENIELENAKKEQLQELREEFFPGMEALRKLRKDIKVNKELLKKSAKHQKKISAHEQYKLTKEVCMQNNEIFQREERVNENKNKIHQLEQETGTRKQIHHSKKGSEICSIYSKLSSMEDRTTYQNSHQLEPEVVVQSPTLKKKQTNLFQSNTNNFYPSNDLPNYVQLLQQNERDDSLLTTQMGNTHHVHQDIQQYKIQRVEQMDRIIANDDTTKQTQERHKRISSQILPSLSPNREGEMLKRSQNTFSTPAIRTSQYFLYQDKGIGNKLNEIQTKRETQSRTLSNKRNQSGSEKRNPSPNNKRNVSQSTHRNQSPDTQRNISPKPQIFQSRNSNFQLTSSILQQPNTISQIKHRSTLSSKSNTRIKLFLPIHSEKIFNGFSTARQSEKLPLTSLRKLSSKDMNDIIDKMNPKFSSQITLTNHQYKSSDQRLSQLSENPIIQQTKQLYNDNISSKVGQQICFDDGQVEKIPIKRFDLKKNYLTANKITIVNHMQKPILIKND